MWIEVTFAAFTCLLTVKCQFHECHDDSAYEYQEDGPLEEMQFTWLGSLQYIHIKNGTPHYFRVPRVVLITRQFVLCTAVDAAQVPVGYALGNVAFGEYERDESECGVTTDDISRGAVCEPAALIVPLADVLLHPEYKHFSAPNSLAILKLLTPVRSEYMLPVCLPYKNYLVGRDGRLTSEKIYHVDFTSDVPRDILDEEKEMIKINWLPRELCYIYDVAMNKTNVPGNGLMCSTGCGFHSGAPSIVHEHTGHWTLVALSRGGSVCPDPLRATRPPAPPRHIAIHPYVPWITAAITGKSHGAFHKDDPFGFIMPRATTFDSKKGHAWSGHWWMGGIRCFDRGEVADDMFKFYHEIFNINPAPQDLTFLNYYLQLYSKDNMNIICIKVGMPYRAGTPSVWDLDSPVVKVRIPALKLRRPYKFVVEAWAYNATQSSDDESYSNTTSSESKI